MSVKLLKTLLLSSTIILTSLGCHTLCEPELPNIMGYLILLVGIGSNYSFVSLVVDDIRKHRKEEEN